MNDSIDKIRQIKASIERLIELQRRLIIENKELQKRLITDQQKINTQNKTIEELLEKNRILRIAKSVKNGAINSDLREKIDEMVRELDKCIGLLNK